MNRTEIVTTALTSGKATAASTAWTVGLWAWLGNHQSDLILVTALLSLLLVTLQIALVITKFFKGKG